MKKALLAIAIIATTTSSFAAGTHWVNGYTKSNGTYVQGHYRSNPDGYCYNNIRGC